MSDEQRDGHDNDSETETDDGTALDASELRTDSSDSTQSEQRREQQTEVAMEVAEVVETSPEEGTSESPQEPEPEPTVSITIDGREHQAKPGQLVIDACAGAGIHVPHFCYHPRMAPVGMCRQCLVEIEGPRGTMLVVSCMTPVAEGQVVHTATPTVKRAQEGVVEMLLLNHPLDCPVCDKGGECPLQDQAMSHGPGESRYLEQKRNYEKPIPVNDLVYLDRERCILCDRCTRFADEVAGDKLIHFISRGNDTQVMTFPDEPFSSYFSGNTVQICPVGALTAKPYRFKARPWDLEQLESTCTTCSVGCRTVIQSSRDQLLRYQGVDSEPVNWGWLCDRGRFGFEAVNNVDQRLGQPQVRAESGFVETSWNSALRLTAQVLTDAIEGRGPASIGLIGGARGTNEDAYAWARLADAVGITRRDAQMGDGLPAGVLGVPRATIAQAVTAPTVILLGPDLKEELPVLYLRIRDAAEQRRSRLIEFAPIDTGLTRYAWRSVRHEPSGAADAVAATLAEPEVAEQLGRGPVVVILGRQNLAERSEHILAALAAVRVAAPEARVLPVLRRGNVTGALQLGLAPSDPADDGLGVLRAAAAGELDVLVLVGADPLVDCPDAQLARQAFDRVSRVIAVDTFLTASAREADVVLPAAAYGEKAGTTTNLEGRVTTLAAKVTVHGQARPDWMIAVGLATELGHELGIGSVEELTERIAASVPAYAGITLDALSRDRDGLLATGFEGGIAPVSSHRIERNSYDYRLVVSRKLYDQATMTAMSPSLAPLALSARIVINPADRDRVGVAEGTEVRVIGSHGEVVLPLHTDSGVPRGIAWSPFNQAGGSITEVIDATAAINDVRIERR